ncbi:MAG TPA: DUF2330 domain-containing protein [Polyangiaceae bacterium]
MPRVLVASLLAAALVLVAPLAAAFCGFYVSGADAKLTNGATVVVLLRDGSHTVLSMQNHYRGPPEGFAMVVPVPVVLAKQNVRTLPADVFDRVDQLAAPRLVEYWEQDPCSPQGIGLAGIGGVGFGAGSGRLGGIHASGDLGVTVEAQFTVAEYEIVILSAEDAAGLDTWLRRGGYRIPEGAAEVLRPYVEQGTKFFVAKVDPAKVKFENGAAMLSPLRFDYDSPTFSLPVRLGLLNSGGVQDLVVHILAQKRYELANYPNVTIPTNLDVPDATREHFASTYADLFDHTLEQHPGAIVTEYAWSPGSCDPCPGPTLTPADFATLGADVAPSFAGGTSAGGSPVLRQGATTVAGPMPLEVIQRIVRQNYGRFRLCYENALRQNPSLKGRVTLSFTVTPAGDVTAVSTAGSDLPDAAAVQCMARGVGNLSFPTAEKPTKVKYPLELSMGQSGTLAPSAMGWVLTRLHARYGKEALGQDLVFRAAEPIEGGRESRGTDGQLEQGARPSSQNNFQARYAIRHPWEGAIACASPVRGVWGARPDASGSPPVLAARNLAFAQRGVGGAAILAAASAAASAAPVTDAAPGEDAGEPSPTAGGKRGCGSGCALGDGGAAWGALAGVAFVVGAVGRRRARRSR